MFRCTENQPDNQLTDFQNATSAENNHGVTVTLAVDPLSIPGVAEAATPENARRALSKWAEELDPDIDITAQVGYDREPVELMDSPVTFGRDIAAVIEGSQYFWGTFSTREIGGMSLRDPEQGPVAEDETFTSSTMIQITPFGFGATTFDYLNIYIGDRRRNGDDNPLIGWTEYTRGKAGQNVVLPRDKRSFLELATVVKNFINRARRPGEPVFRLSEVLDADIYTVDGEALFLSY